MVTRICKTESIRDLLLYRYPDIEVGDGYEIEEVTEHYSCGRLDVRGGDIESIYGNEIGVPPMRSEDWQDFGGWLDDFRSDEMWSLSDLVEQYEQESGRKIRWADDRKSKETV
jgi:hypothetical protein